MEYIDSVLYETNEIPFNKTFCTVIVFVVFVGCNYFVNLLIIVPHFDFCNQFIIVFEKKTVFQLFDDDFCGFAFIVWMGIFEWDN